jgi:hypothetical protein
MKTRGVIAEEIVETAPIPWLGRVLGNLGIAASSWFRPAIDNDMRERPGPAPKPIAE